MSIGVSDHEDISVTSSTRVVVSMSAAEDGIALTAPSTNTAAVRIGGTTTVSTTRGVRLIPGGFAFIPGVNTVGLISESGTQIVNVASA